MYGFCKAMFIRLDKRRTACRHPNRLDGACLGLVGGAARSVTVLNHTRPRAPYPFALCRPGIRHSATSLRLPEASGFRDGDLSFLLLALLLLFWWVSALFSGTRRGLSERGTQLCSTPHKLAGIVPSGLCFSTPPVRNTPKLSRKASVQHRNETFRDLRSGAALGVEYRKVVLQTRRRRSLKGRYTAIRTESCEPLCICHAHTMSP
jgi:hypothetical protein